MPAMLAAVILLSLFSALQLLMLLLVSAFCCYYCLPYAMIRYFHTYAFHAVLPAVSLLDEARVRGVDYVYAITMLIFCRRHFIATFFDAPDAAGAFFFDYCFRRLR